MLGHATPSSESPPVVGLRTIDHLVPFQCSTSVFATDSVLLKVPPTATQSLVLGHTTPKRKDSGCAVGFGLGSIDHRVPFQCSTNVFEAEPSAFSYCPTAKQLLALRHATPKRPDLGCAVALGLGSIDHRVPFQCSTNVFEAEPPVLKPCPTAKQLLALGHATSEK